MIKKLQSVMHYVAINNFMIWIALGILSLFCMPLSGDYGGCTDTFDAPTVEDMREIAPKCVKPYVGIYKPLVWLIEPVTDGQSSLFALTGIIGLILAILLFAGCLYEPEKKTWVFGAKFATDILLYVYLVGYVLIIVGGLAMYIV